MITRQDQRVKPPKLRLFWPTAAVALGAAAALYAGLSLFFSDLPPAVRPAFRPGPVRWVAFAAAAAGAIAVWVLESRRRNVAQSYLSAERLNEDLERRAEDSLALHEASRGLNRASPENIMEAIARGALVTVGAVQAVVYGVDEDRNVLIPLGWTTPGPAPPDEQAFSTPAGSAALQRRPVLSNDPPPSSVTAPVVVGEELIGVITATASGKRFGDRELRVLTSFADDASVAVARASALQRERQVAERLAEIDRAKSDFVAAITHELKTPLTSMLGYASILRKRMDALPRDRREQFFDIIQRQGERILKLIGELLESSRMESGLWKLRREHIDLAAVIGQVVKDMKPAAKRHTIAVEIPVDDPGLYGDPDALEHVVTNLLDNALKYSPKKTKVDIWVDYASDEIRINVRDQGYGIPPEELPHLFERFTQGSTGERTRASVGLGLFLVRSLVEAQGGRVSATSTPGTGSTFTVAFPRRSRDRMAVTLPAVWELTREAAEAVREESQEAAEAVREESETVTPPPEQESEPVVTLGRSSEDDDESPPSDTPEPARAPDSVDAETLRAIASGRAPRKPSE